MGMKEKTCGKDEINSVFLRGYVWHKFSFTSFCCYSTVLTVTSPLILLNVPFGIFVSPLQLHVPVSFSPSLSSFSCMLVLKEASKIAILPSLFRMRVCRKEMEGDDSELSDASSFKRSRGEGTSEKGSVWDRECLFYFPSILKNWPKKKKSSTTRVP